MKCKRSCEKRFFNTNEKKRVFYLTFIYWSLLLLQKDCKFHITISYQQASPTTAHVGWVPVQRPSAPHCLVLKPATTNPGRHAYVTTAPNWEPLVRSTLPFNGSANVPQSGDK